MGGNAAAAAAERVERKVPARARCPPEESSLELSLSLSEFISSSLAALSKAEIGADCRDGRLAIEVDDELVGLAANEVQLL